MAQPSSQQLPRTFWFLVIGVFINRLGSFLYVFLAYYLTKKCGFSEEEAGLVVAGYAAGAMISGPLGGFLADWLGRRTSMLLATLAGAGAMLHLGFAHTYLHILFAAFLLGLLGDLYRPAMNAAIADLVVPANRTRAYGWSYWAANLGFSVSSVVGGFLAEKHFSLLFFLDAGTTVLFGVLFFMFVPDIRRTHQSVEEKQPKQKITVIAPYLDKVFLAFIGIQFLLEFLLQQSVVALPLDVANRKIPIHMVGYFNSLNALLIVFLQPILRKLVERFRRSFVLASGGILLGLGLAVNLLAFSYLSFFYSPLGKWTFQNGCFFVMSFFPTVIWTMGEILMFSMVPTIISDLAPAHARGSYQGAYQLTVSSAMLVSPLYGTFVLSRFGSNTLWLSCFSIGIFAGMMHLLIASARRQKLSQLYGEVEAKKREDRQVK